MIPKTMRAMVYLKEEEIELQQIPVPYPGAGEVLVKVNVAATCGTDVKCYRRGHPKFPPPFIFGHEFAGEIVAKGRDVAGFPPGTRVTANVFAECGRCFYCQRGQGNLCENLEYNFGAFAEYLVIPASIVRENVFEIPDHISDDEAALLEPLVTVVNGQRIIGVKPGEIVAIIGAGGPIGLMHQQLALHAGAERVIAIGHSDPRLEVAARLGADLTINSHTEEAKAAVLDATNGYGPDVVIECAGQKDAWESAVDLVRRGGRVLWFGGLASGVHVEIDAAKVHYGSINLYNVHGGTAEDARRAFELIATRTIDLQSLISGRVPLENVEDALKAMIKGQVVKMIVDPSLEG